MPILLEGQSSCQTVASQVERISRFTGVSAALADVIPEITAIAIKNRRLIFFMFWILRVSLYVFILICKNTIFGSIYRDMLC